MARNKIASPQRVKSVIKELVESGFEFVEWTEDSPYDSPKVRVKKNDITWSVAIEKGTVQALRMSDWSWGKSHTNVIDMIEEMGR